MRTKRTTLLLGLFSGVLGAAIVAWAFADRTAGADEPGLSENEALSIAEVWASDYMAETIGSQLTADGAYVALESMELVDFRFVEDTKEMVTSISTGISVPEPEDFWIVSWEQPGVDNITTGNPDGTAAFVIVVDDESGKVSSAGAGLRQPGEQALACGSLPSYEELFGDAPTAKDCEMELVSDEGGGQSYVCR